MKVVTIIVYKPHTVPSPPDYNWEYIYPAITVAEILFSFTKHHKSAQSGNYIPTFMIFKGLFRSITKSMLLWSVNFFFFVSLFFIVF